MKIRSAKDVIEIARERGFQILVDPGPPPMPRIRGNLDEATEPLMAALRAWRLEIIEIVLGQQCTASSNS